MCPPASLHTAGPPGPPAPAGTPGWPGEGGGEGGGGGGGGGGREGGAVDHPLKETPNKGNPPNKGQDLEHQNVTFL